MPVLLVQRRLHWIGHAARRIEGELIKDLLLPTPTRTWRRRAGGQLKTWATTIKADLEQLSLIGSARWRKDWVKCLVSSHRAVETGVPPSETWSTQLVVPAQSAQVSLCLTGLVVFYGPYDIHFLFVYINLESLFDKSGKGKVPAKRNYLKIKQEAHLMVSLEQRCLTLE